MLPAVGHVPGHILRFRRLQIAAMGNDLRPAGQDDSLPGAQRHLLQSRLGTLLKKRVNVRRGKVVICHSARSDPHYIIVCPS
jgi:hypothetical protein